MPTTYPPAPATLSGDVLSINRFLQSPTLLQRALRTIAQNRFIADVLLTGRYQVSGGSIQFQQGESIFSDRAVESVAAGAPYPRTTVGTGAAQIAAVTKWGQDADVTDEAIKRFLFDPVNRALLKLVNQMVKKVDTVALAVIASQVTTVQHSTAAWAPGTALTNPLYDLMKAQATINALNQGYEADTVVVDDVHYAQLMNNPQVLADLRREDPSNPVYTGQIRRLAGMNVLVSPNLPTTSTALVLDSSLLGGMADENLGGVGYTGQMMGVEGKAFRALDGSDGWVLRARRVTVPIVIEPNAAVVIDQI